MHNATTNTPRTATQFKDFLAMHKVLADLSPKETRLRAVLVRKLNQGTK